MTGEQILAILAPVVVVIVDVAIGAVKNSTVRYKGVILPLLRMLGSGAKKLEKR